MSAQDVVGVLESAPGAMRALPVDRGRDIALTRDGDVRLEI
ncbi:hypothetical protein AB0C01_03005 [Micromonospora sp. NPDC048905]